MSAHDDLLEALKRAVELMDATARFMENNPIAAEYTVNYDEADCDGGCLQADCEAALDIAREAIAKAEGRA